MSLTMVSSNVAGYTKKQLTAAVVFIGFCIGNAVGPQTFISSQARESLSLWHSPFHLSLGSYLDETTLADQFSASSTLSRGIQGNVNCIHH